jgi:hypothetical protein
VRKLAPKGTLNLFEKEAMKGRTARSDTRVGHGPEGGAWINTFTGNGRRMERVGKE